MTRYITANGEDVEIVEETRNGDRHLVAKDVPIVKPMELDTGYVPEEYIAASTDVENTHGGAGWAGTTPTVNHPRNHSEFSWHDPSRPEDDIVLAANLEVQETLGVGTVENDRFDGEYVRADIAVNADRAEEMGGEASDIVANMDNGEGLEVSSQYLHADLPPGEYDGAYRSNPKAIAAPDSVALIPNGRGVCSIEDGCGIAPGVTANVADHADVVANAAIAGADDPGNSGEGQRTTMQNTTQMAGVRQLLSGVQSLLGTAAGPADDQPAPSTAGDESDGNEGAATGGASSDSSVDDGTDDDDMTPTGNANGRDMRLDVWRDVLADLAGDADADAIDVRNIHRLIAAEIPGASIDDVAAAIPTDDLGEGFGADEAAERINDLRSEVGDNKDHYAANMERDDLIDEITANSNIKRGSLEGMGDTCLETTHENIVANTDDGDDATDNDTDGDAADDDGDEPADNTIGDMSAAELGEALKDQGFVTEDSIGEQVETAANQLEAEERAEKIVANSDEYGEDDVDWIADLPEKELERKERGATQSGGLPASGSTGFGAAGNEDTASTDDMPDLEVN